MDSSFFQEPTFMRSTLLSWFSLLRPVDKSSRKLRRVRVSDRNRYRIQLERLEDRITPTQVYLSVAPSNSGNRGDTMTVAVNVDTLQNDFFGTQGLSAFNVVIRYDNSFFSESNADISLGSLLPSDWQASLTSNVQQGRGEIVLGANAGTIINATGGGVLANILFHVKANAPAPAPTLIDLAADNAPFGSAGTILSDAGFFPYILTSAPTNAASLTPPSGADPNIDATYTTNGVNLPPAADPDF